MQMTFNNLIKITFPVYAIEFVVLCRLMRNLCIYCLLNLLYRRVVFTLLLCCLRFVNCAFSNVHKYIIEGHRNELTPSSNKAAGKKNHKIKRKNCPLSLAKKD